MAFNSTDFAGFDPYRTYSESKEIVFQTIAGSDPLADCIAASIKISESDVQAMWRLGRDAFRSLRAPSREAFEQAFGCYREFIRSGRSALNEMVQSGTMAMISDAGSATGDWERYGEADVVSAFWQIYLQLDKKDQAAQEVIIEAFIFLTMREIDSAIISLHLDGDCISHVLAAADAYGNAMAIRHGSKELQIERSRAAADAANERHRNSEKNRDKVIVKKYWDLWVKNPSLYPSKAEFIRDMFDGKTQYLAGSHEVLKRWMLAWEEAESITFPYSISQNVSIR